MNERIRELAEQAEMSANKGDHVDVKLMMAKFAELIVGECARAANDWYQNHNDIHWDPAQHIRNHFGVEE